jgi:4-hydroxy-3-polyprenylbenzoate decarboxylase
MSPSNPSTGADKRGRATTRPSPGSGAAPRRIVVGMAGAPGAAYTVSLLSRLRELGVESHLVTCGCSRAIVFAETGLGLRQLRSKADGWYHERNQAAAVSSGSFLTLGMAIVPCTMRSLAAIVTGMADNLVQRAADVTLKEGRRLVVAMAESSRSPIGQENLRRAEDAGIRVVMLPPAGSSSTVAEQVEELLGYLGLGGVTARQTAS